MKALHSSAILILFSLASLTALAENSAARKRWHDNKYSMFIHFGVYSELGGVWEGRPVTRGYSEQIQAHAGILTDIYDDVPSGFNPVNWKAEDITALAKKAGMRSIVITSKHHDGFCMYKSAYTRFNIVDATPFKRDIIRELADACKKEGLQFGLYFSLIDYRIHPMASHNANPISPDHHEYNKKQVTELLTRYGPISEMWFDMGSLTADQSREIYDLVHKCQPDCMVSGRLGNDAYDFCVMGDNEYPDYRIDAPWQTPASMFDETWGYRSWQVRENAAAKSREKLLSLVKVVSRGGNFLLNIGPKGDGTVVPYEAKVLQNIGNWLAKNGEAVYGTRANPLNENPAWGEITAKDNCLYLILSGETTNLLALNGITGKIKKATLLDEQGISLPHSASAGAINIRLSPELARDPEIRVVKLEFDGAYKVPPKRVLSGKPVILDFSNSLKHYSYSCIDYYNNHRSVVRQSWFLDRRQRNAFPTIYYTPGELGKEIELTWNGQSETLQLDKGEKIALNQSPGEIRWGEQYTYGPVEADFNNTPGPVLPGINPQTDWMKKDRKGWVKQEKMVGRDESFASKPIQQLYVLQEITSDKEQCQLVEIGSGDGIQVWLNGETLVLHNNPRDTGMNREIVLLPLKTGRNQLLVRFYNRYGYLMVYGLDKDIPQFVYRQKLQPRELKGLTECVLGLPHPESQHRTIRMNNVRIEL